MVTFRTEDQSALHCVAEQSSWSCFCSQGTGISNAFAAVSYSFYSLLKKGLFYTIMPSVCLCVCKNPKYKQYEIISPSGQALNPGLCTENQLRF
jgi:hypothetical protein